MRLRSMRTEDYTRYNFEIENTAIEGRSNVVQSSVRCLFNCRLQNLQFKMRASKGQSSDVKSLSSLRRGVYNTITKESELER
jgi:hypothetical protein